MSERDFAKIEFNMNFVRTYTLYQTSSPWNIISYRHIGETCSDYFRKLEQNWYDVPQ